MHKYHVDMMRNTSIWSKLHFHDDATDTRVSGTFVLLMNFVHEMISYDVGILNVHLA